MKSRIDGNSEEREFEREREKEFADSIKEIADSHSEGSFDEEKVYDLLAGYVDKDGVCHKTFTIREMTGADEEYVNRADIKSNGAKITTALLSRCVQSVGTLTRKSVGNPKDWEDIFKKMFVIKTFIPFFFFFIPRSSYFLIFEYLYFVIHMYNLRKGIFVFRCHSLLYLMHEPA